MKSRLISFATLLLIFPVLISNGQQNTFSKVFFKDNAAVQAYSLVKSKDHHFLVAGAVDTTYYWTSLHPFFMKTDSLGTMIWGKTFGPDQGVFNVIIATSDSCFVLAGRKGDNTDATTDALITKITRNGDTLWTRTFDAGDVENVFAVKETFDKGFIVTGIANFGEFFVCKLTSSGNQQWMKVSTYYDNLVQSNGITQAPDSSYFLTGYIGNLPWSSAFLMKLTKNGTLEWTRTIWPGGNFWGSIGNDVLALPDGLVIYGFNAGEIPLIFLIKTDFTGNLLWQKAYTCSSLVDLQSSDGNPSPRLFLTSGGSFVFVNTLLQGSSYSFPVGAGDDIFKFSSTGAMEFNSSMVGIGKDVCETEDGGFIAIGDGPLFAISSPGSSGPQFAFIKTDSAGNSYCAGHSYSNSPDSIDVTFYDQPFSFTSGGMLTPYHPKMISATIASRDGCMDCSPLVKEHASKETFLEITPNPSSGKIRIAVHPEGMKVARLEIYDAKGSLMYCTDTGETLPVHLDLSGSEEGIYTLRMNCNDRWLSERFMIHR
ncbi:MAG: T9SS type A sorting domain-containing protein [Bacteroidetes bacterium]|nr:T9SS type A sorting domain-containing protein [Bacteroidota bacterium]